MLDDLIEVYAWNCLYNTVRDSVKNKTPEIPVFLGGERTTDPEAKDYLVVWALADLPQSARRDVRRGNLVLQISCHSRCEDIRDDHDLLAPWKLAAVVKASLTDKDIPVRSFNVDPEVNLGQLNLRKPRTVYVPRPHHLLRATGTPQEQPNVHSVVLTYTATFVAA